MFPPVVIGLIRTGKAPTAFMITGFLLCLAAVLIVSIDPGDRDGGLADSNFTSLPSAMLSTLEYGLKIIDENSNFDVAIGFFIAAFVAWCVVRDTRFHPQCSIPATLSE